MSKTPFEKAGYTKDTKFKFVGEDGEFAIGEVLWLDKDDGTRYPSFTNGDKSYYLSFKGSGAELVEVEPLVEVKGTKLQFPCCVATSEIKDEETFKKILDLFVDNGADKYETDWESGIGEGYSYFGVDYDRDTLFSSYVERYSWNDVESEVTVYTLEQLLAFLPKEEAPVAQVTALLPIGTEVKIAETSGYYGGEKDTSNPKDTKGTIVELDGDDDFCYYVRWENGYRNGYKLNDLVRWEETPPVASQEGITERSEDNPSVGIDYSVMGTTTPVEPLITITQEVKYTVVIKGTTFTLTQDELDGLAEELLGFTTL